jgi:hypothetical protein
MDVIAGWARNRFACAVYEVLSFYLTGRFDQRFFASSDQRRQCHVWLRESELNKRSPTMAATKVLASFSSLATQKASSVSASINSPKVVWMTLFLCVFFIFQK